MFAVVRWVGSGFLGAALGGCSGEAAGPAADRPARVAAMAAAAGAAWQAPVAAEVWAAPAEEGRRAWENTCLPCHGAWGAGDGTRAARLSPKPASLVESELPPGAFVWVIENGSPGTAMAGFRGRLPPNALRAVTAHALRLRADGGGAPAP
jgi:cytochrome c553